MRRVAQNDPTKSARKGPRDLTTGPVGRTLVLFSLPVLGSNILQSINCSANAIWVSHVLGEPALAAISNANQIFFLMLGAVFGITMAANILLAQSVGAKNRAMAKKEDWIIDSKPVKGDPRAFDVTVRGKDGPSQVRILTMRHES